ncbi:hypothetical protein [Bacillus cereus]|nr:hypothetical protein [Bacillus cereus]
MDKKELIIKIIEGCWITMNKASILQNLEIVLDAHFDCLYVKVKNQQGE